MSDTIDEARDGLETAIILALHMDKKSAAAKDPKIVKGNWHLDTVGLEAFCPPEPAFPKAAYTFDAQSSERLYAGDMTGIVVNPITAIGHRLETMMICDDGLLKWSCIKPMPRPKRIVALTNQPHQWMAFHYRAFSEGKPQSYVRRPMAITADGDVCKVKPIGNWHGFDPSRDQEEMATQLAMSLSIFEDAHRAGSFLACVEEHVRLMFPIGAESYQAYLAMRDGYRDTPTARRNPILHWCSEHFRRRGGKVSAVQEHLRGAEEFVVGPMRVTIEANNGYGAYIGAQAGSA